MKKIYRLLAYLLAVLTLLGVLPLTAYAEQSISAFENGGVKTVTRTAYQEYIADFADFDYGTKISVNDTDVINLHKAEKMTDINGSGKSGIVISDSGTAQWSFTAPRNAIYKISIEYVATEKGSGDLELGFLLDDTLPFDEVKTISLNRTYEQASGEFKKNSVGNDIQPDVAEILKVSNEYIADVSGYVSEPFDFYLSEGNHTITLNGSRGKVAIFSINFLPYEQPLAYKEYSSKHTFAKSARGESVILEGEHFNFKNSVVITPKTDRSSPITSPQEVYNTVLNTVGGSTWKLVGDSVVWNFHIKEAGLYKIILRARQNIVDGMYTCRKLYIDGNLPFKEAEALRFEYNSDWQVKTLGDGETEFEFYLKEGNHTLMLEAVAGPLSENVGDVQYILNELYRIYRRIVMITGASPDINRDYSFNTLSPDEIEQLGEYAKLLQADVDTIDKEAGANGSYTSLLKKLIAQLEGMSSNQRTIAKNLERFKSNLGSISNWLLTAMEQPLEIDNIEIAPSNSDTVLKAKTGFLKAIFFNFKSFLSSFVNATFSLES